jgi:acyl-coenzyme A synthetase/AMP-(fatty) acid ligase
MPCTTLLTPKDIEYRLRVSHAKVFVSDEVGAEKFGRIGNVVNAVSTKVVVCLEGASKNEKFHDWNDYQGGLESKTRDGDWFEAERNNSKATDPCIIYFTR